MGVVTRRFDLRDERGIALVVALSTMFVLSLALATLLAYTAANSRSAARSKTDQVAFSLAEGGVDSAFAVLLAAADPIDPASLPSGSQSLAGGTSSWSATFASDIWTITGTGTVPSPTGSAPVTRTVTRKLQVTVDDTPWDWTFSQNDTGCVVLAQNAVFAMNVYIRGSLCMAQNSKITGPRVYVAKTSTLPNGASIGLPGAPIEEANLVGGYTCPNNNPNCVYADVIKSEPQTLEKPPLDLQRWYDNAKPGPKYACNAGSGVTFDVDGTLNRNRPPFELTPLTPYTCQYKVGGQTVGELSWTPGVTGLLRIKGTIFFDGNVTVTNALPAVYEGRGTIYASGAITFGIGSKLCGVAACNDTWNPENGLVALVSGATADDGLVLNNNSIYQGAAYVNTDYRLQNNAQNWGPVIARNIFVQNNAGKTVKLKVMPPGVPGIEETVQLLPDSWSG